jgi:hypothetical protein
VSDTTNTNKGIQAYRWLVTIGMGLIMTLSWRQLDQIDKMAAKLEALQIQVTTLSSTSEGRSNASTQRLDTGERRNDRQDQQIEELQRRLWQIAPTRSP